MTNVDFFRDFAADETIITGKEEYYFEHNRQSMDLAQLFQAQDANDTQLKLLHYTSRIRPVHNESGNVYRMRYEGRLFVCRLGDPQDVIDTQRDTNKEDGIYERHVKPLVDAGGIFKEIADYNNQVTEPHDLDLNFDGDEVYMFPIGTMGVVNGVWLSYAYEIDHDTHDAP